MANVSHANLLKAFEKRWDFLSARTLIKYGLKDSGVGEKKDYSEDDISKILKALTDMGERGVESVNQALFGPPPEAAPEAAAPPAEEKKEDKKEEKKEDKKEAKKEEKKEDKKEDKKKKGKK